DALFERSYADYKIYSRAADQEARAAHWLQAGDAARLAQLDAVDRRQARRLAHRLQRKLQASRLQQWCFEQEQGRLDSRRLAKLLTPGAAGRVFRVEQPAPLAEACVTLLVDHSASMSAERRLMAALAIDLAVHTLELCRIDCEVLGYTTRYGATNPLAARWQREAAGAAPGRLNAVRHIVHKTPQERWCRARRALGLLLNPAFGHENIDGEALYWAARRLLRQPQPRKILLVLSDGSPYDAATAAANGRSFLERHLRAVIADIEAGPIRLAALGAGQEVSRFYAHAVTLRQPQAVAEQLFETLGDLLTGDRGATGRYSLRRK
ncbi:MAG: cobaltochelatase subunit CobT, partial [Rhodocyclaceae bacterium]|nr:cobaltochelatase subunit CobT [Rhodocyclaceae bacterium]